MFSLNFREKFLDYWVRSTALRLPLPVVSPRVFLIQFLYIAKGNRERAPLHSFENASVSCYGILSIDRYVAVDPKPECDKPLGYPFDVGLCTYLCKQSHMNMRRAFESCGLRGPNLGGSFLYGRH